MGESVTTRDTYPRLTPGIPILGKARVIQDQPAFVPDRLRYSGFPSDSRGGPGATVEIVHWPGPPPSAAWAFQRHPRPAARSRVQGGRTVPGLPPQTVSDRRRAELATASAPVGPIEVLEVT
jgi:hypothetical protein